MDKLKMKWNEEVDRVCPVCDRHFTVLAYRLKQGRGKFCSRSCNSRDTISHRQGYYPSAETKGKIAQTLKLRGETLRKQRREETQLRINRACSEGMRQAWRDPERRAIMLENLSEARLKIWANPEFKAKMSQIHKELWKNPEFRAKMPDQSKRAKKNWQDPKYRQHQIEAQIKSWQDPEIVARRLAGLKKRPTKPEQRLIDIFSKSLPQFEYNGDFSLGVMLGGLHPDFVNVNGKKQLVEFFGDYYHSPEVTGDDWRRSELGKVMIYNSLGWKCLVIWEHELNQLNDNEVVGRVKSFFRGKT